LEGEKEHAEILRKLLDIHQVVQDQLKIAKAMQKYHADKRTETKVEFNEGDYVLLSTKNLKLHNQPSKKFKTRYIGPYLIERKINSQAYRLKLPKTMKVHPVFHISLLREYCSEVPELDEQDNIPAVNDRMYGDDDYHIHSIVDHKTAPFPEKYQKGPALLFRVRWEGYGPEEDTWEPYVNIQRTIEFDKYIKSNDKFRLFLMSEEYRQLSKSYQDRFPKKLTLEVTPKTATRYPKRGRNVRDT